MQRREIPHHARLDVGNGVGGGAKGEENGDGEWWLDPAGSSGALVSGLNPGPPAAGGSRTVQTDVATSGEGDVEIRLIEQIIPERFQ